MNPVATDPRYSRLADVIRGVGSAIVAYSGGVDSTLVAVVAHRELGSKALAVTGVSASLAESEGLAAGRVAASLGLAHRCIATNELAVEGYRANAGDRCFFCKSELFENLQQLARDEGYEAVFSGDNLDDVEPGSHRPGMRAARDWSIRSPLIEAGLGKNDIRALALALGLPNHAKVASPCLASRIPHGTRVDRETLGRIERAEAAVRVLGFEEFRVRHHGEIARIEVPSHDIERAVRLRDALVLGVRRAGYRWVTLDLAGFASGSLNVVLADGWKAT